MKLSFDFSALHILPHVPWVVVRAVHASPRCPYGLLGLSIPVSVQARLVIGHRASASGDAAFVPLGDIYGFGLPETDATG